MHRRFQQALGRLFDVLVADALYLSTSFVRALEKLGLQWAMPVKENEPELPAEAEWAIAREADSEQPEGDGRLKLWWER